MNDTDKKRLEEIERLTRAQSKVGASTSLWVISHLKDALARIERVRELHKNTRRCYAGKYCAPGSACMESFCLACGVKWPCSTIAILDGGNG